MKRHASMNRIYRLVWKPTLGIMVAVAENAKGRGKSVSGRRLIAAALALTGGAFLSPFAMAGPTGGQVVSGAGSISQQGSTTNIQQTGQNLSLNWQSFNIAKQETVNFLQPSASAIAVNRIFDTNGTQILGHLNANGQIYLINPNGIIFGQGSQVNVGGLVASTLDIAGNVNGVVSFAGNGTGSVINQGTINAGSYVALLGNHVSNQGVITAQLGTVALGAGSAATLTFSGNGLVHMQIDQSVLNSLAENGGLIQADGGQILMTAGAKNALLASVVNNTGIIEARTVNNQNGTIILSGGMVAGTVNAGGTVDVSSATSSGGQIIATAHNVLVADNANLNATGATGGGTINVGGGWQGSGGIAQATNVYVSPKAKLDASAIGNGNGGEISVRSDITNSASTTQVYGSLLAKGGANGGDGGRIETSGHWLDVSGITISTSSPAGKAGEWLLDPYNVIISSSASGDIYTQPNFSPSTQDSTILASDIANALQNGNNVTITTGTSGGSIGDITVNSAITKASGNTNVTLTLQAADTIVVNQAISNTGGTGQLNVKLLADNDNGVHNGVGIVTLNNSISTGGGYIQFGDGATMAINGVTTMVGGDVYVGGSSAINLTTGGGGVTVNGQMLIANTNGLNISTTGATNGNVILGGLVDSGNTYAYVSGSMTWNAALTAAASGTAGAVGSTFLATPSTRLDNSVAGYTANYQASWLGAQRVLTSCAGGLCNTWYWVAGPLGLANGGTGTAFFTQNGSTTSNGSGGVAINGAYTNWNGGEPNNYSGANLTSTGAVEYVMQFTGTTGVWNDLAPTNSGAVLGYVKGTNLAASPLTVNAGTGTVTFSGAVGSNKALSSLNVTAGTIAINGGAVTTSGVQTYTGAVTAGAATTLSASSITTTSTVSASSNALTLNADAISLGGNVSGTNTLTIQPQTAGATIGIAGGAGTLQLTAANFATNFVKGFSGITVGNSTAGAITVGGATTLNDSTAFISNGAITISGAITASGNLTLTSSSNINLNANLTSTLSGAAILAKATGNIIQAAGVGVTTNAGNVTYWANSANSNSGLIQLTATGSSSSHTSVNTNGGNIVMGGGADSGSGTPGGYAWATGSNGYALNLADYSIVNAGTGNVTLRGESACTGGGWGIGVRMINSASVSGNNITIAGVGSNNSTGAYNWGASMEMGSSITGTGAISVTGTAGGSSSTGGNNWGVDVNGSTITGTGTATISVNGTGGGMSGGGTANSGVYLQGGTVIKTASGTLNITGTAGFNGSSYGIDLETGTNSIGASTQSGAITLNANTLYANSSGPNSVLGTGTATIAPLIGSTSFGNALTTSGWSFGSTLTGLTIGVSTNTQDVTIANATSIAGPISIYGGNINLNANLTSTLSGAAILVEASGSITTAASTTFQTNNGNLILWSNTGNLTSGSTTADIVLGDSTTLNTANGSTSATSGGGNIFLAGGSGTSTPTGYAYSASGNTNGGITIGTTTANQTAIYSGGGNIVIGGQSASTNQAAVAEKGGGTVNAGGGTISIQGSSTGGHGVEWGIASSGTNSSSNLITSSSSATSAISITGTTTAGYGIMMGYFAAASSNNSVLIEETGTGGVSLTGTGSAGGYGVQLNSGAVLAASGAIAINGGTYGVGFDMTHLNAAGTVYLGQEATSTLTGSLVTSSSSNITITGDVVGTANTNVGSTGTLTVQPYSTSFTSALTWPQSGFAVSSGLTGLTLGKAGNTADITVGSAQSVAGPISIYGGNITLNAALTATGSNTITLAASGSATESVSGNITATNLLLNGTGSYTLGTMAVGTLAAMGVTNLSLTNSTSLSIGTVGATNGISASGTVSVATTSGNLTVSQNVGTTNITSSAVVLDAGTSDAVGTTVDNIVLSGSGHVSVGSGGRAMLYTGSIANSTGVTALVGSGSGNFRYDSKAGTSNFTSTLGASGNYAVYREQPTLTITANIPTAITYGSAAPTYSATVTGGINGDTSAQALSTQAAVADDGVVSTSGHLTAVSHVLTASGAVGQLGYALSYAAGALTVNKLALTGAAIAAVNTTYGTTAANGAVTFTNNISGDTVGTTATTVSPLLSTSSKLRAGSYTQTAGTLTGTDAANYSFAGFTSGANYSVAQLALTGAAIAAVNTTYGTTAANGAVTFTNNISGDTVGTTATTVSPLLSTSSKLRAGSYTQTAGTLTGTDAANYSFAGFTSGANYSVAQLALTISATGVNKVYDGSTVATETLSDNRVTNDVLTLGLGTATFADKNAANGKVVTVAGITLTSTDSGNYTFNTTAATTANITPKALTATVAAPNKVYNGNTTAAPTLTITGGLVGTETVTATGTATFNTKDVTTANLVTVNSNVLADGTGLASNYSLVSGETVVANITPATLTVSAAGTNRVYNGQVSDAVTLSDNRIAGDVLTIANTAANFADKNVGTAKSVTVSGITVTGTDAGNYTLNNTTTATAANITQLASVAWTGPATGGNWANPANWAGGAIPDLSNVATVVIPNGNNVTFDSTVAGPVNLKQISSGGLTVNSGALNVATALNLQNYSQSGGAVAVAGSFTVTSSFAQTSGTINMGNVSITQAAGPLTLGMVTTTGNLTTRSNGATNLGTSTVGGNLLADSGNGNGNVTQTGPLDVNGTTDIVAGTGNIVLNNTGNMFQGKVTISGASVSIVGSGAGLPSDTIINTTSLLESNILTFHTGIQPQSLSLSPTITITQVSSSGTEMATQGSGSGTEGNSSSSGTGSGQTVNTVMSDGGMGPVLRIIDGGIRMPDNMILFNK